ncbi:MAG: hypothetical protein NT105_23800 [Verrucomicrobia bacterium]|nr:hypothetical protein [Verrucomicrobiota bacterium]
MKTEVHLYIELFRGGKLNPLELDVWLPPLGIPNAETLALKIADNGFRTVKKQITRLYTESQPEATR